MHEDLEWDIRVPFVSNVFVIMDVLVVFLLLSGGLAGLVLFLTRFSVYRVFRVFLIADGILMVLLFGLIGYVFTNRFMLTCRIDDEGVLVQVGSFKNQINRFAGGSQALFSDMVSMGDECSHWMMRVCSYLWVALPV